MKEDYLKFVNKLIEEYKIKKEIKFRNELAKIIKSNKDNKDEFYQKFINLLLNFSSFTTDELENKIVEDILGEENNV